MRPNLENECELWEKDYLVIGIDEVGRGALSGPVYVGSICFKPLTKIKEKTDLLELGIDDSKRLTPKARLRLNQILPKYSLGISIAAATASEINKIGIVSATALAMRRSVMKLRRLLPRKKLFGLMDAFYVNYIAGLPIKRQKAIVKGDRKSLSIAAASIVAKVARDSYMSKISRDFEVYKWRKNKGYGTREHLDALINFGPTALHRNLYIRNVFRTI